MKQSLLVSLLLLLLLGHARVVAQDVRLLNVSYDPTRELYSEVNRLFADDYKSRTGVSVAIEQSHGGSSKQARSLIEGLKGDVATLALGWDVIAIERGGLIKPGWKERLPYNAAPYTSVVAFFVRKGNPKNIKDWDDLVKPGVQVIASNPKTSGGGRWTFLGAWGYAAGARTHDLSTAEGLKAAEDAARAASEFPALHDPRGRAFVEKLYRNVPVLDTGARGSTVTFAQKGMGDVLINWENELRLAQEEFGADRFEIVYPSVSVLGEPPVAVVDAVVDRKGTRAVAEAYLKFLYTREVQEVAAQLYYRPRDVEALKKYGAALPNVKVFTTDETFGGWVRAHEAFFKDGGVFDGIFKPTN